MSVFIDTAVIMYAGGREHPMKQPCLAVLGAVADGRLDGVISTEVVQEIFHRFVAIQNRAVGVAMAEAALDLFSPLAPISENIIRRMPSLIVDHPSLSARDLIHVATCRALDIEVMVSPDTGFDEVDGLSRIDPVDAVHRLL